MIHPGEHQKAEVETILKNHPDITFLFHGGEENLFIMELLGKYKNFYYSLDANLVKIYGWERRHVGNKITKDEWLVYFRKNFDEILDYDLEKWGHWIERYPDRFTWGTDRALEWHFDSEVGGLIEELGRAFIGQLSPSVREKFAYKNAERILGGK